MRSEVCGDWHENRRLDLYEIGAHYGRALAGRKADAREGYADCDFHFQPLEFVGFSDNKSYHITHMMSSPACVLARRSRYVRVTRPDDAGKS